MNKYSTKRSNNSSHSFDSYYHKHRRDYSPPPSRSHSRNSSQDSLSPRRGGSSSYPSKYSRKSKDRDSSKYYDGSGGSKSKYMRISRSPIGKHGHEHESHSSKSIKNYHHSKDYLYGNGHHHNHHSSTSSSSSSSAAAATSSSSKKFGDWSEQISSSGKIYFYNSKTEVSQWQKPKEWLEWERRHYNNHHSSSSSRYSSFKHHSSNHRDKYNENDNNPKSYSYSNNNYDDDDDDDETDDDDSRHDKSPPINHNSRSHHSERISKSIDHKSISSIHDKKSKISNDDSATTNHKIQANAAIPRLQSFNSINCNNSNNIDHNSKLDKQQQKHDSIKVNNNLTKKQENMSLRVSNNSSSTSTNSSLPQPANDFLPLVSALASIVQQQQSSTTGQHSLNFSKIISQIHSNNSHNQGINFPINKTQEEALKLLKKTMQLSQQKSQQINQINQQQSATKTKPAIQSNCRTSSIYHHQHLNHHHSSPNSHTKREHSKYEHLNNNNNNNNNTKIMNLNLSRQSLNSSDGIRQDLDQFSKKLLHSSSPSPGPSVNDTQQKSFNNLHRNINNINNDNNNNVHSVLTSINNSNISQQQQQKNSLSNLSRFKHLYREDLVHHVTGWHSDQLEKQANLLFDQANTTGNHLFTKVSAELKTLRSFVRVTEIQTTLQKHRILFLSEQIKKTEEWKGKQFTNYS